MAVIRVIATTGKWRGALQVMASSKRIATLLIYSRPTGVGRSTACSPLACLVRGNGVWEREFILVLTITNL